MDTQNPVVRLSHIKKSFGKNEVLKRHFARRHAGRGRCGDWSVGRR